MVFKSSFRNINILSTGHALVPQTCLASWLHLDPEVIRGDVFIENGDQGGYFSPKMCEDQKTQWNNKDSSCWNHWASEFEINRALPNIKTLLSEWTGWNLKRQFEKIQVPQKRICCFPSWQITTVFNKLSDYWVRGHNQHCYSKLISKAKYSFTSLVLGNTARKIFRSLLC